MADSEQGKVLMTDLISLHQASQQSGFSTSHLALLARKGDLQAWKFGKTWLTTKKAVLEYQDLKKKRGRKKKP